MWIERPGPEYAVYIEITFLSRNSFFPLPSSFISSLTLPQYTSCRLQRTVCGEPRDPTVPTFSAIQSLMQIHTQLAHLSPSHCTTVPRHTIAIFHPTILAPFHRLTYGRFVVRHTAPGCIVVWRRRHYVIQGGEHDDRGETRHPARSVTFIQLIRVH